MRARCPLLSSIWRRTLPQLSRNFHTTSPVERVVSLSSEAKQVLIDNTRDNSREDENGNGDSTRSSNAKNNGFGFRIHREDYLRGVINESRSLGDLLEVIERHSSVMEEGHLMQIALSFGDSIMRGVPAEELRNHPVVRSWMDAASPRVGQFRGKSLIRILFLLKRFEFQPEADGDIFDNICSSLRLKIPELTFRQLIWLYLSLRDFQNAPPSAELLSKIVSAVSQARMEGELDQDDPWMCSRTLMFALYDDIGGEPERLAIEAALKNCRQFLPSAAYKILCASAAQEKAYRRVCENSHKVREILKVCSDIVAEGMEYFPDEELKYLLNIRLGWSTVSDRLIAGLWDRASEWNMLETKALVGLSIELGYMTLPLADRIVEKFLEKHDELRPDTGSRDLRQLALVFATSAMHNNRGTEAHERAIRAMELFLDILAGMNIQETMTIVTLSYLLVPICCCGIFPRHLLDRVFSRSSQEEISTARFPLKNLLQLEELTAHNRRDSSPGYNLDPEFHAFRHRTPAHIQSDLVEHLVAALGGSQFFVRDYTISGLKVNFLAAMDSHGSPIPIPGKLQSAVHLKDLPTNSKVVAIVCGRGTHFSSGLTTPRFAWKIRSLQAENFCPLLLDTSNLEKLPAEMRTKSLLDRIKEASDRGVAYSPRDAAEDVSPSTD